jgi:hypothetical protein
VRSSAPYATHWRAGSVSARSSQPTWKRAVGRGPNCNQNARRQVRLGRAQKTLAAKGFAARGPFVRPNSAARTLRKRIGLKAFTLQEINCPYPLFRRLIRHSRAEPAPAKAWGGNPASALHTPPFENERYCSALKVPVLSATSVRVQFYVTRASGHQSQLFTSFLSRIIWRSLRAEYNSGRCVAEHILPLQACNSTGIF